MDRFASMQAYVKVVELGSFSAAARQLRLSPAMVTRHVSQLEDKVGARLLNRTTRHLSTTAAGQSYFERCLSILAAIDDAEAEAGKVTQSARGTLRITAPAEFGDTHLSRLISRFLDLHPDVDMFLEFSNRQVDLVQDGFDLALRVARTLDGSLIGRRLARSHFRVVAGPDYIERHGEPETPEDLTRHVFLAFSVPSPWVNLAFECDGNRVEIRLQPRILSTSAETLNRLALNGSGIAVLPTFVCGGDIAAGRLVTLLPNHDAGALNLHVLYPHKRFLPARTRLFVDYLVETLGSDPDRDPWCKSGG
ncbi:LysR family transcriptional regulator [Rhizobium alvei]|uniref:LysR family transcriptional regulator n=1 Tax=Rhizobium alvei TaxID=1132659 RepID=A0ABT8YH12_9HYPH|nr:LysR family transcriptional regulator [Rhizobium alvei]MDO6962957.1 LysR family transcriptional regulator [Rhizobium alvei]